MKPLRIRIVGGSLAGLFAGVLLQRDGHDVCKGGGAKIMLARLQRTQPDHVGGRASADRLSELPRLFCPQNPQYLQAVPGVDGGDGGVGVKVRSRREGTCVLGGRRAVAPAAGSLWRFYRATAKTATYGVSAGRPSTAQ
jgi:hypothetical protein